MARRRRRRRAGVKRGEHDGVMEWMSNCVRESG